MNLHQQVLSIPYLFCLSVVIGLAGIYPSQAQEVTPPTETPAASTGTQAMTATPNASGVDEIKKDEAADAEAPEKKILKSIEVEIKKQKGNDIFERSSVPSLVFTSSQYALLREARIGFNTRMPTQQEAKAADPDDPNYKPPPSVRDIRLGGIAFNNPDDWTIWLNSSRVTPDALPSEAVDLRVYKDFIEVKWFDAATNQVFPIRLRTNQRFNLDTHLFLPAL